MLILHISLHVVFILIVVHICNNIDLDSIINPSGVFFCLVENHVHSHLGQGMCIYIW